MRKCACGVFNGPVAVAREGAVYETGRALPSPDGALRPAARVPSPPDRQLVSPAAATSVPALTLPAMTRQRDPFANFDRMRRQIDELFGDVWTRAGLSPHRRALQPAGGRLLLRATRPRP